MAITPCWGMPGCPLKCSNRSDCKGVAMACPRPSKEKRQAKVMRRAMDKIMAKRFFFENIGVVGNCRTIAQHRPSANEAFRQSPEHTRPKAYQAWTEDRSPTLHSWGIAHTSFVGANDFAPAQFIVLMHNPFSRCSMCVMRWVIAPAICSRFKEAVQAMQRRKEEHYDHSRSTGCRSGSIG